MNNHKFTDLIETPKILIVDDDVKNRFAFTEVLEDINCELFEADCGEIALNLITQHQFALILLDVQMPKMDGFEVANLIKKHKRTQDIPIIFVTAFSKDQQYIRYGHELGAVDYIVKPIDPFVLTSKVSVYLDHYRHNKIMENQLSNLDMIQKDLSRTNTELEKIAKYDALTGLYNRLGFDEFIEKSIKNAKNQQQVFCMMFMDLDKFKSVNDQFGHDIGDQLLVLVSHRFQKTLTSAIHFLPVKSDYAIARLGGDEFAIILNNITKTHYVGRVAERLIDAFRLPFLINQHELSIGLSIGIAFYPDSGTTVESIIKSADTAMYRAKNNANDTFYFFNQSMQDDYQFYKTVASSIQQALDNNEFYLAYQPIYLLNTQTIVGCEILCRWQHQILGDISPNIFITIAEEIGLINPLGHWIFKTASQEIATIDKTICNKLFFAINTSIKQFDDHSYLTFIQEQIKLHNLPSHIFEIELTESTLTTNSLNFDKTVNELAKLGVRISIDDFGSGYSSLKRLHNLAISILKIDQSFMKEIHTNHQQQNMIITILDLAKNLNLEVIAEGIETKEQLDFLKEHHCQYGQGFYFSKPLIFNEFIKLLK
ncbi:EAL domain-containing protein [Thiotrichales bacterium 19X7-9]|nr:EAL domain-containing protein [Thiotrichales bacterium 19X7-9]